MKYLLYFVIILFSNMIGAIAGLGGGVIIKPMLDFLAYDPLLSISFFSSIAVFTMSISATYKQVKNGVTIHIKTVTYLAIGSILGGILGNALFDALLTGFQLSEQTVLAIQIILSITSLFLVLFYNMYGKKQLHFDAPLIYAFAGVFLGSFSTLLGIGGGPINVALLIFLFGIEMKEAVVYSIITIFFSQLSKLTTIAFTIGFQSFDLNALFFIIPSALLGGYLGSCISSKLDNNKVKKLYQYVIIVVILINIYNGISFLLN